jgi:hypothetical protein
MARIPVYCSHCGAIFESRAIRIGAGTGRNIFVGNMESCIQCGKMARIIDGMMEVSREDILLLVDGPQISKLVLQQFSKSVERAAKDEITLDELQSEAETLDPALGKLVAKTKGTLGIAGLITLMLFMKSCNFETKLDLNRLYDQWLSNHSQTTIRPSLPAHVKNTEENKSPRDSKSSSNSPKHKDGKPSGSPH